VRCYKFSLGVSNLVGGISDSSSCLDDWAAQEVKPKYKEREPKEPELGDTKEVAIKALTLPHRMNPSALELIDTIKKLPDLPTTGPFDWIREQSKKKLMEKYCQDIEKIFSRDKSYWKSWILVQKWEYQEYGRLWWKKKGYQPVGKPEWREVIGNNYWSEKGWSEAAEAYRTAKHATEACCKEFYIKYDLQHEVR